MRALRSGLAAFVFMTGFVLAPGVAGSASITPIGALDGDAVSYVAAVSADGSTVVGVSEAASRETRAFVWDRTSGMRTIPGLSIGRLERGRGVVGGRSDDCRERRPRRIPLERDERSATDRSAVRRRGTHAYSVSGDGSTVVGTSGDFGTTHAFIWDASNGTSDLGSLPGGRRPVPLGVSGDGSVVVGNDITDTTGEAAFRWTAADGMQNLGLLPGGEGAGAAISVSDDGSTVVGASTSSLGLEAFTWDATNGMQGLGDLPQEGDPFFYSSFASDVSGDGSVVVGRAGLGETFVWDAAHGMRGLDVLLEAAGVDLSRWRLVSPATIAGLRPYPRISADGRTIAGLGYFDGRLTSFVAVIPEPSTGLLLGIGLGVLAGVKRRR